MPKEEESKKTDEPEGEGEEDTVKEPIIVS